MQKREAGSVQNEFDGEANRLVPQHPDELALDASLLATRLGKVGAQGQSGSIGEVHANDPPNLAMPLKQWHTCALRGVRINPRGKQLVREGV